LRLLPRRTLLQPPRENSRFIDIFSKRYPTV